MVSLLSNLNRIGLLKSLRWEPIRNLTTNPVRFFQTTPTLLAEPLKKKKRMDPAVLRAREERKKKKIEKQIRRLEKNAQQLKPIEECEVALALLDEKQSRLRQVPTVPIEELERRVSLQKQWALFKKQQHLNDIQMFDRIFYAQQKALDELRNESVELYNEAMQIDFQLLPFNGDGPLETPPISNYDSPDGDYLDVSKKWD